MGRLHDLQQMEPHVLTELRSLYARASNTLRSLRTMVITQAV
ncbi:MAG: hypothetical protein U1F34_05680 [Gammaproteobacteria bacterium]